MSRPGSHRPSLLPCPWIESLVYESLLNHHLSITTKTKNPNRPKVVQVLAVSPCGSTFLITDGTTSIVAVHTRTTTSSISNSRRDIGPGSMIRIQNWDLIISTVVAPVGNDDDPPNGNEDDDDDDLFHKYARVVHGRTISSSSNEPKSSPRYMMIYLQFPLDAILPIGRYSCTPPSTVIRPVLETLNVRRAIIHLQQQQQEMVSASHDDGPTTSSSRDRNDVDVVAVVVPPAIQRVTAVPVGPSPTTTTTLPIAPIASLFSTLPSSSLDDGDDENASFWRYIRTVTPLHHNSDHPLHPTIHDDRAGVIVETQLPPRPDQVIPVTKPNKHHDLGPVHRSSSVLPLGNVEMLFGPSSQNHTAALLQDICHTGRNPFSLGGSAVPVLTPIFDVTMEDPPRADDTNNNDDSIDAVEKDPSSSTSATSNVQRNTSDDIGINHMLIESSDDDDDEEEENVDHGGAVELDVHEEDDDPSKTEPAVATTIEPSTSDCPLKVPPVMVSFAPSTAVPESIPPDIDGGVDDNRISENSAEIEKDGTQDATMQPVDIPIENNNTLENVIEQPPAAPETDPDTRPEVEQDIIILVDDSDDDIEVLETQQCIVDHTFGATHRPPDNAPCDEEDDDESEDDSVGAVILETQCENEVNTSTVGKYVQGDTLVSEDIVESFKTAKAPPVLLDHADGIHSRETEEDVLVTQQHEEMESVVEMICGDVDQSMTSPKKRRAETSTTNNIQIGGSDRMSMDVVQFDTENDETNKQSKKRRKKAFCFGGDALRSLIS